MSNTNKRATELPKRAFTKPSVVAIVFFIIILLILIPHTITLYTKQASLVQILFLFYLSPLVLPGLFCAYHTGLTIGKISYTKWHKGLLTSISH